MRCWSLLALVVGAVLIAVPAGGQDPGQEIATLRARVQTLEALLADRDREVIQLREYSQKMLDEAEAMRSRLEALGRELETERQARRDEEREQRRRMVETEQGIRKELVAKEKEVERLQSEAAALRTRAEESAAEQAKAEADAEGIRSRMASLEEDLGGKLREREAALETAQKEVADLRSETTALEVQLARARETETAASAESEQSGADVARLRRKVEEQTSELESRGARIAELRRDLEAKTRELSTQTAETSAAGAEALEEVARLRAQIKTVEGSFTGEQEKRKSVERELASAHAENRKLEERLQTAESKAESLRAKAVASEDSGSRDEAMHERVLREVEELRVENEQLQRSLGSTRGKVASLRAEVTDKEKALAEREDAASAGEETAAGLRKEKEALERQVADLRSQVTEKDAALAKREEEAKSLASRGEASEQLRREKEGLERQVADLRSQVTEKEALEQRVAALQSEVAARDAAVAKLEIAVQAADGAGRNEVESLRARVTQLEVRLAEERGARDEALRQAAEAADGMRLSARMKDLETRLAGETAAKEEALSRLETMNPPAESGELARQDLERVMAEGAEELEALRKEMRLREADLDGARKRIASLERGTEETRRLEKEIEDLKTGILQKESELGQALAARDAFEQELAEARSAASGSARVVDVATGGSGVSAGLAADDLAKIREQNDTIARQLKSLREEAVRAKDLVGILERQDAELAELRETGGDRQEIASLLIQRTEVETRLSRARQWIAERAEPLRELAAWPVPEEGELDTERDRRRDLLRELDEVLATADVGI